MEATADTRLQVGGMTAPVPAWHVIVDPNVPDSRVSVIRSALEEWAAIVPCTFVFEISRAEVPAYELGKPDVPPPAFMTMTIRMYDSLPMANGVEATGWGESYPDAGSRIGFTVRGSRGDFPRVARHELGHAFHVPHLEGCDSVMSNCGPAKLTRVDATAYAAVWCPMR